MCCQGLNFDLVFHEYQASRAKLKIYLELQFPQLSNDIGHDPYLQTDSRAFPSKFMSKNVLQLQNDQLQNDLVAIWQNAP